MHPITLLALALPWPQSSEPETTPTRGLVRRTEAATPGYTLFAPLRSYSTYLVDLDGQVVHQWRHDAPPGQSVYLLDNGHLLRCERADNDVFSAGGEGGRIREYDWEGQVVWEYLCSDKNRRHHHDIEPLPNGNLLLIAWEYMDAQEALALGRSDRLLPAGELWPDMLLEIKPTGSSGGEIVWEWHAKHHLIQELDESLPNFGSPAEQPWRIDINATPLTPSESAAQKAEREHLEQLGYVTPSPEAAKASGPGDAVPSGRERKRGADWLHLNAVDYSPELDLIVVSSRELSEIWFIDHSTTTAEAQGSRGGRYGRGGDLVFRLGHPRWHGSNAARTLFGQHDVQFIAPGLPGAGHILLFNNGERGLREESTVEEWAIDFSPKALAQAYDGAQPPIAKLVASLPSPDFCGHISGAQRLPNGNTLICAGETGRVLERTPAGEVAWEYLNPFGGEVPARGGPPADRPDARTSADSNSDTPPKEAFPVDAAAGAAGQTEAGKRDAGAADAGTSSEVTGHAAEQEAGTGNAGIGNAGKGDAGTSNAGNGDTSSGHAASRDSDNSAQTGTPGASDTGAPPPEPRGRPGRGPSDPTALFRATRLLPTHPGLSRLQAQPAPLPPAEQD
jgi:hypothetical protein